MRSFACAAVVSLAAAATALACLPDPQKDFDDFKSRTAGIGESEAGGPDLDAAIDSKPPEVATEALYVGICVTALASKDPEEALRFYTKSKYVPDPAGGGKLTLEVTPLLGWENGGYVTPTSVSQSQTRGSPLSKSDITVAAGGRFTADLGVLNLPGAANSISGRDAVINDATLDGKFGTGAFCSTLGGHLTVPYEYDFVPSENTCLFLEVKEGDPVPVKKAADFVCPL